MEESESLGFLMLSTFLVYLRCGSMLMNSDGHSSFHMPNKKNSKLMYSFNNYVTPQTQSMSSTRDNGRTPIKLCLTSVPGLTNELQFTILAPNEIKISKIIH